ncbi:MAG: tetratricopeptide repeat protein [Moorea sp. SIO3C2]|nr:tetratricopeptide repeat protein [Moorena sp. SIO3C2]
MKPVAISKNHIDLCKPESQDSQVYLGVKKFIKECLNTPGLLDNRNGNGYSVESFESYWNTWPPEAQQLGYLLSLFAPAPFQWSLVESCVIETEDEEESEDKVEDLKKLRDRFLVNGNLLQLTKQQTYQLNQRIRKFLQTKLAQILEADCYKQRFCQGMVAVAKKIPKTPTRDQIAAVTPAIPHLAEAATVLTDWLRDEDLIWPFIGLGGLYQGQGTYDQAEPLYQQCLEITRSRLGENHPDVATILNNLGLLYYSIGRDDEAKALYQQALEIAEPKLGSHHPMTRIYRRNLEILRSPLWTGIYRACLGLKPWFCD